MAGNSDTKFTIVGAGLAGALMALYLGREGYTVEVYERRPDPRKGRAVAGRSINLALSVRGIHALHEVGVADRVLADAVPMRGRMIHAPDGHLTFQPYGTEAEHYINSVSRAGLNRTLVEAAEKLENVTVRFDHRCVDVDLESGQTVFVRSGTAEEIHVSADAVIGADGAFSAVRAKMQRQDRFGFEQSYLEHGYKELCIPPAPDGDFALEPNALHIWPRRSMMMIALPNADRSFTCTLFWPFEGRHSFAALTTADQVLRYFNEHYGDAVPLMPTLVEDYLGSPPSSMVTIRCQPWHAGGKVVLVGDAAHAVVPFYGQGMNCAFEDCTALMEAVRKHAANRGEAFRTFGDSRKCHADALADLALGNFIEMRDKTADPAFLRKKKRERLLHRLFPKKYVPLYTLVSFTRTPYATAVGRAAHQDRVVRNIARALISLLGLIIIVAAWMMWT